jgi:hypothetical protein
MLQLLNIRYGGRVIDAISNASSTETGISGFLLEFHI